ncbi:MAG: hypothetical protein V5A34_11090 [Halapricum sp.]
MTASRIASESADPPINGNSTGARTNPIAASPIESSKTNEMVWPATVNPLPRLIIKNTKGSKT